MKQAYAPQLIALSEGVSITLDKPIMLIGRHQECDVQIASRKISRRHCCIALVDDHLVVRDLGSTNGIRINGVKIVEGNLQAGDELTIGNMRYQVRLAVGPDRTAKEQHQNGIQEAPRELMAIHDQSLDVPIPLSDEGAVMPMHEAPTPGLNGAHLNGVADPALGLEVPEEFGLLPIEPPRGG